MILLNIFEGENISSISTIIVLIGTNIASGIAWILEKKKRKYNELRDKGNIVDELSQKFDAVLRDNTELKLKVSRLELEVEKQKLTSERLETENQQLRDNQQKLIEENKQLKYTVECMKYAGKKKQPVPKRKDTPCSN